MRLLPNKALIFVFFAMCVNCFFVSTAAADSATYVYRGNKFEVLEFDPDVFSLNDRVTGRFTVDCSIAHPEGTCANLPYDNYFWLGAVRFESIYFSAGPAILPTDDGHADVSRFRFSTDENGQLVHWDIDLSFWDPSGLINVDTDKKPWGNAIDSAAALGGGASVQDNPGTWKRIGRPGGRPTAVFRDHNRTFGNSLGADVCVDVPRIQLHRCANLFAWEDYDLKGNFQFTGIEINYWFIRHFDDGGYRQWWRWMFCQAGPDSIKAQTNHVTLETILHPENPECDTYGEWMECDALGNCDFAPRGFEGPTEVTGDWIQPINTGKAVVNLTNEFYDPWSETSHRSKVHCVENGGDMMKLGGFSVGIRFFPFDGFATQGGNHYWLRSCNNNFMQK